MGPQKEDKRKPLCRNKYDFGRLSRFPENIVCWGHFPKWIFAEGRSTRSLWCLEKSKDPFGGPRIIWWWRDFPRMSKFMIFKETHYSVRQKIGDAGSISTQNINPLHSVTPKRPELPYEAPSLLLSFFFLTFSAFWPYWIPFVAL